MNNFDNVLSIISEAYSQKPKLKIPNENLRPSAVLVPIFEKNSEPYLLLTKRTEQVSTHKGQIAFPGGAYDSEDYHLQTTAIRETEEEIGLPPDHIQIIAELDDTITPTQFHITPFAGKIEYPETWKINEYEIAELIEVPLSHLLDNRNHRTGFREFQTKIYEIHFYDFNDHVIWGVTGLILFQFLEKIRARF